MSLPNGWKKKSALDVLTLQGGYAFKSTDAQSSGVKWLKIANVGISQIKWEDESFLPYEFWEEHPNFQLNDGDIVVAMTRPLLGLKLKIARLGKADVPALLNQRVGRILPSSGVDKDFIYQTLTTKTVAKQFDADLLGTDPPNLGVQTFKRTKILIPPLPEQKAIADLLSTWDSAIEKTERLIAAKEKRFQWLLDELIGQAKNHKNVTFGSLLKESRIPDDENDPRKRLSVRLHLKGVEVRDYRGTESEGATAYFKRKAGQFIYGKQNVFKGSVGIVPSELDGYSSTQDIPAFDISERVCAEWLLFLFSYPNFYKKLELYASGSGSKRLHPKELFQMRIPLPPIGRQNEIAKVIGAAQKEIDILKSLAEKYKEQKRGLMQKLLTGEWRVKVA